MWYRWLSVVFVFLLPLFFSPIYLLCAKEISTTDIVVSDVVSLRAKNQREDALLSAATKAAREEDYTQALNYYQKLQLTKKRWYWWAGVSGEIATNRLIKDFDAAREVTARIGKSHSDLRGLMTIRDGDTAQLEGDLEAALAAYQLALTHYGSQMGSRYPVGVIALKQLSSLYLDLNDPKSAAAMQRQLLKHYLEFVDVELTLAKALVYEAFTAENDLPMMALGTLQFHGYCTLERPCVIETGQIRQVTNVPTGLQQLGSLTGFYFELSAEDQRLLGKLKEKAMMPTAKTETDETVCSGYESQAYDGFTRPMENNPSNYGDIFMTEPSAASYGKTYQTSGSFHPGVDLNAYVDECSTDVQFYAVARGCVSDVLPSNSGWGTATIEHYYIPENSPSSGDYWVSQYGHGWSFNYSEGDIVGKGVPLGRVGNKGTDNPKTSAEDNCHLHFELREPDHPSQENSDYWIASPQELIGLYYQNPESFIDAHHAYSYVKWMDEGAFHYYGGAWKPTVTGSGDRNDLRQAATVASTSGSDLSYATYTFTVPYSGNYELWMFVPWGYATSQKVPVFLYSYDGNGYSTAFVADVNQYGDAQYCEKWMASLDNGDGVPNSQSEYERGRLCDQWVYVDAGELNKEATHTLYIENYTGEDGKTLTVDDFLLFLTQCPADEACEPSTESSEEQDDTSHGDSGGQGEGDNSGGDIPDTDCDALVTNEIVSSCTEPGYESCMEYSSDVCSTRLALNTLASVNDIRWGKIEDENDAYVIGSYKIGWRATNAVKVYYNVANPETNCNETGCGGSTLYDEVGTKTVVEAPGIASYDTVVAYNNIVTEACNFYCYTWLNGGTPYYGWNPSLGETGPNYIHVLRCYEASDCGEGETCDRAGSWENWQCIPKKQDGESCLVNADCLSAYCSTLSSTPICFTPTDDVDSDGDGLSDASEVTYGTDPSDADSDDDGLSDGTEIANGRSSPLVADSDRDGVDDFLDLCRDTLDVSTVDDNGCDASQGRSETKVTATDSGMGNSFGGIVSMDGNRLLIGAPQDDDNGDVSGSAYVYRLEGSVWVKEAKLLPHDGMPFHYFGTALSLDGDVAMVGARADNEKATAAGAVYVFRATESGWKEEAKLTASDATHHALFGYDVALEGNRAVIGTTDYAGWEVNAAYVFQFDGSRWSEVAKLTPSDGEYGDHFGTAVAMSDNVIAIGAYGKDNTSNNAGPGAAYVYRFDGSHWFEQAKLTLPDAKAEDSFGTRVAVDGDVLAVAAYGRNAVYMYRWNGSTWEPEMTLTASLEEDQYFAFDIALGGDLLTVSVNKGVSPGAVILYQWTGEIWRELARITASDGYDNQYFGNDISLSLDRLLVGAPGDNSSRGAVYVYDHILNPELASTNDGSGDEPTGEEIPCPELEHQPGNAGPIVVIPNLKPVATNCNPSGDPTAPTVPHFKRH